LVTSPRSGSAPCWSQLERMAAAEPCWRVPDSVGVHGLGTDAASVRIVGSYGD
jgi:hypothetical protein